MEKDLMGEFKIEWFGGVGIGILIFIAVFINHMGWVGEEPLESWIAVLGYIFSWMTIKETYDKDKAMHQKLRERGW